MGFEMKDSAADLELDPSISIHLGSLCVNHTYYCHNSTLHGETSPVSSSHNLTPGKGCVGTRAYEKSRNPSLDRM